MGNKVTADCYISSEMFFLFEKSRLFDCPNLLPILKLCFDKQYCLTYLACWLFKREKAKLCQCGLGIKQMLLVNSRTQCEQFGT